ncbi:MAG: PrsW family intramembrane metalloprotease [Clostridia bacterium]|jgi:RsiW-degrading membrane proteinase PrsW (M82 family)
MRDFVILVGGAALPSLVLIIWFYRLDHKRPEPVGLVGKSVLFGFLATVPAIILEMLVDLPVDSMPRLLGIVWTSFLTAALVEEGIKYLVLKRWLFRLAAFDEIMDGIVYAVCLSLGFAFAENIIYGLGDGTALILRAFTAVPLHATATGIMGYWFGMARRNPDQAVPMMRKGFLAAVMVHGFYDFFLFTGTVLAFGSLVVLGVAFRYLMVLVRLALAADDMHAGELHARDLHDSEQGHSFLP